MTTKGRHLKTLWEKETMLVTNLAPNVSFFIKVKCYKEKTLKKVYDCKRLYRIDPKSTVHRHCFEELNAAQNASNTTDL